MCSEDVSEILVAWLGAVAGDFCMFIFSTILYYIGYNNFKTINIFNDYWAVYKKALLVNSFLLFGVATCFHNTSLQFHSKGPT